MIVSSATGFPSMIDGESASVSVSEEDDDDDEEEEEEDDDALDTSSRRNNPSRFFVSRCFGGVTFSNSVRTVP